jgi:hypothetical protein
VGTIKSGQKLRTEPLPRSARLLTIGAAVMVHGNAGIGQLAEEIEFAGEYLLQVSVPAAGLRLFRRFLTGISGDFHSRPCQVRVVLQDPQHRPAQVRALRG